MLRYIKMATFENFVENRDEYEFVFDAVMKENITRSVFKRYLIETRSVEIINFLDTVRDYRKWVQSLYSDTKNKENCSLMFLGKANEIRKEYIEDKSKNQLNLDAKLVKKFEANMTMVYNVSRDANYTTEEGRYELRSLQYDIFTDIESHLLDTLKNDSFRRCVRSKEWLYFIGICSENREAFEKIKNVISRIGERHARYTLEDIKRPNIVSFDFQFVKEVCEDQPHWVQIHSAKALQQDVEIYKSKRKFIMSSYDLENISGNNGNSSIFIKKPSKYQLELDKSLSRLIEPLKYVFTLDHHYEVVLASLTSNDIMKKSTSFTYNPICKNAPNGPNSMHSVSVILGVTMPSFFSHREMPCLSSAKRTVIDGRDAILMIIRPYDDAHVEKLSVNNQRCRTMQCWTIVKIRDNLTRVTVTAFSEFGGWFGTYQVQKLLKKSTVEQQTSLMLDYKANIVSVLSNMNSNGYKRPQDIGLLQCYESNLKREGLGLSMYEKAEGVKDLSIKIDKKKQKNVQQILTPDTLTHSLSEGDLTPDIDSLHSSSLSDVETSMKRMVIKNHKYAQFIKNRASTGNS